MGYTFEKSSDYGLLKEGEYEVKIDNISIQKTKETEKEYINIVFKIRDDVEQDGKNRLLFESIWKEKENPEYFNRKRLNRLVGTQDIEDGKSFSGIDEILEILKGAFLIIVVKIEDDDYRGEKVNRIAYYKPSKNGAKSLDDLFDGDVNVEVIEDDTLPF